MDPNHDVPPVFFMLAVGRLGEFGANQSLPWPRQSEDMRRFRTITKTTTRSDRFNAVIMGWKTWMSIGAKPLPERINFVLTSRQPPDNEIEGVIFVKNIDACYALIDHGADAIENVFVIGGMLTFDAFLADDQQRKRIYGAYITYVDGDYPEADVRVDISRFEQRFPVVVEESTTDHLRFSFRQ